MVKAMGCGSIIAGSIPVIRPLKNQIRKGFLLFLFQILTDRKLIGIFCYIEELFK